MNYHYRTPRIGVDSTEAMAVIVAPSLNNNGGQAYHFPKNFKLTVVP